MSQRSDAIGGKYVPVRPLAAGGMAEVDLARQVGTGGFEKLVVLKRIRPEFANNQEFVTRFLDEARTVADLRHPNLVQVYEAGRDGNSFYLAMAFVHGVSVRQMGREAESRRQLVPLEHAVLVVTGAARGLHYAHEKVDLEGRPLGIVHRDVSPQNLLVSFQGEVKVADFGIAHADNQEHLTRAGQIWGKLDYMAPEQARGGVATPASDQFALAIVAWELFTGARLFRRETDADTLRALMTGHVPSIASRAPGFPPALERIVERALAGDPAARYPSCAAFAADLEQAAARIPLPLSEGKMGEWLSALFPAEAAELSLPVLAPEANRQISAFPAAAGELNGARLPPLAPLPRWLVPVATWLRRNRGLAAGIAGLLVVGALTGAWLRSEPRLAKESEAQLAAGKPDEALASALAILRGDPVDERGRELATRAATLIAERKSAASPREARSWLQDLIDRQRSLEDPLRTELLILEVRNIANVDNPPMSRAPKAAAFVSLHSDRPQVALAGAVALRNEGVVPDQYMWMLAAALDAGLSSEPIWYTEAMEVLTGRCLPDSEEATAARRVASTVDRHAFEAWGRKAVFGATGYELLNAIHFGFAGLSSMDHLRLLEGMVVQTEFRGESELLSDLRSASTFDQERVAATMRLLLEDTKIPPKRRDEIQGILVEVERVRAASR